MVNRGIGTGGYYQYYYSSRDWRYYKDLLALILRYSQPGKILDVGAGTGLFVECAVRWGLTCIGIEGSADAVQLARNRCPRLQLMRHLLSEPFPFSTSSFQTVVMNQVLEHLEPEVTVKCLVEVHRVLHPGGMLYVSSPSRSNTQEAQADPTHLRLYTPRELMELLQANGFHNILPMNTPLPVLGESRWGKGIATLLFGLFSWDRLSASANCISYKL